MQCITDNLLCLFVYIFTHKDDSFMQYFFLSPSVLVCINRFEITVDQIIMFIKKCDLKSIYFFLHTRALPDIMPL